MLMTKGKSAMGKTVKAFSPHLPPRMHSSHDSISGRRRRKSRGLWGFVCLS
ncbi:hypothetical protein EXN66_Car010109 [Channa argus]|uniref:Uncharacterized protein n=1 Tax=Channa argus TaxID=215402 RepID=A0A6G1PW75_CHAAH|nr:hypothetical protein EXN66_Car010109 [Channa argus]